MNPAWVLANTPRPAGAGIPYGAISSFVATFKKDDGERVVYRADAGTLLIFERAPA